MLMMNATSWMRYAFMRRSYAMLPVHMLAIAKGGDHPRMNVCKPGPAQKDMNQRFLPNFDVGLWMVAVHRVRL